jgi:hypothetical protein
MRKVLDWALGVWRSFLRGFGVGFKAEPLNWGITVFPVEDRSKLDALWWTQHAIVTGRGTASKYASPEGLRYGVYQGERFPDGSTHWGKYWAHARVIVVLKAHERNTALWAHECRHDVLGTEAHPAAWFNGSSLEMP